MGQKDITEKLLEDYNDVFADIVNVLLFDGREVVSPSALEATKLRTQYKADDSLLHEMERDVAKTWTEEGVTLALYGMENETVPEKVMPIRVFGYEGNSYRSQLLNEQEEEHADGKKKKQKKPLYPVVTIVLHFGKDRWKYPKNLKGVIPIPECLDQYVNDFKIHVFDISWLTDEQVHMFKSDFRIVAEYFTQMRKNNRYEPSTREIKHVDAVLKMLSVFGGVTKFEDFVKVNKKKEVKSVGNVIDDMIDEGIRKGIEEALKKEVEKAIAEYQVQAEKAAKEAAKEAAERESFAFVNNVKQIQKNLNLTLEAALNALGTTMEAYEEAKRVVG